jgi:hypothetical protein
MKGKGIKIVLLMPTSPMLLSSLLLLLLLLLVQVTVLTPTGAQVELSVPTSGGESVTRRHIRHTSMALPTGMELLLALVGRTLGLSNWLTLRAKHCHSRCRGSCNGLLAWSPHIAKLASGQMQASNLEKHPHCSRASVMQASQHHSLLCCQHIHPMHMPLPRPQLHEQ